MKARTFHLVATVAWALLVIPTVLWWKESILWVAVMSVYACMVSHWTSYQACRAEDEAKSE